MKNDGEILCSVSIFFNFTHGVTRRHSEILWPIRMWPSDCEPLPEDLARTSCPCDVLATCRRRVDEEDENRPSARGVVSGV